MNRLLPALAIVVALTAVTAACGDDPTAGVPATTDGSTTDDDGSTTETVLTISYTNVDLADPDATYVISCTEDTATISGDEVGVVAADACAALAGEAVRSRLVDGTPEDQVCIQLYGGADTVLVTGAIDGASVDTSVDRINGCGIDDWDTLLVTLLPRPAGAME